MTAAVTVMAEPGPSPRSLSPQSTSIHQKYQQYKASAAMVGCLKGWRDRERVRLQRQELKDRSAVVLQGGVLGYAERRGDVGPLDLSYSKSELKFHVSMEEELESLGLEGPEAFSIEELETRAITLTLSVTLINHLTLTLTMTLTLTITLTPTLTLTNRSSSGGDGKPSISTWTRIRRVSLTIFGTLPSLVTQSIPQQKGYLLLGVGLRP